MTMFSEILRILKDWPKVSESVKALHSMGYALEVFAPRITEDGRLMLGWALCRGGATVNLPEFEIFPNFEETLAATVTSLKAGEGVKDAEIAVLKARIAQLESLAKADV
jgi:hypothetical protein